MEETAAQQIPVVLAASAVICDSEGRVLLIKRGKEPGKGLWSVPGGSVEPGETLAQAAAREALEETGLQVSIGRELWSLRVPTGDGRVYEIHDFAAAVVAGALTAGDDAEEARWIDPSELESLPLTDNLADYLRGAGLAPALPQDVDIVSGMTDTTQTPYDLAKDAARRLADLTGVEHHDVALVLGSGWLPAVDALAAQDGYGATAEIDTTDLPGFSASAVAGHSGKIRSIRAGDKQLLVFLSRTHYYEGKGVAAVVHPVRTAAAAGCRAIVLTNGCGGLKETWSPGTPVLISDHINLTATSPLVGANFVDLTDLYSPRLRAAAKELDPSLDEGVYVQFTGPHYETPAEIGMARAIGGHLVGMSTTLEAIAAREAGMEILGISLVTNLAAGISGQPLNHEEVLEAGRAAASRMGELLSKIVPVI